MRSQMLVGGVVIMGLGGAFFLLELPLVYFWSFPFLIGGGIMVVASPFLSESEGPVEPPPGFRFCVFCGTAVPLSQRVCDHCGGTQPKEES
jgi:hypothetical protein